MTGPEHYVEAERLLDAFKQAHLDAEVLPDATVEQFERRAMAISTARVLLDKAQVHATLAHAAAAAAQGLGLPGNPSSEWQKAIA